MATALAPVGDRDVVRCDFCALVQFISADNNCRRCRKDLDEQPPSPKPTPAAVVIPISSPSGLSLAIKNLRRAKGLSQRMLAVRLNLPRSYVSKIEIQNTTPTLRTLIRIAAALDMSVPELLDHAEQPEIQARRRAIEELAEDHFIAEIMPVVPRLSSMQRAAILAQLRDLTVRQRSRAM